MDTIEKLKNSNDINKSLQILSDSESDSESEILIDHTSGSSNGINNNLLNILNKKLN